MVVLCTVAVAGGSMVVGQKREAAGGQTAHVGGDEARSHGCSDDCKSVGLLYGKRKDRLNTFTTYTPISAHPACMPAIKFSTTEISIGMRHANITMLPGG